MSRRMSILGLALVLALAQLLLAMHGIEHHSHLPDADHDEQGVCVQCLALAAAASAAPPAYGVDLPELVDAPPVAGPVSPRLSISSFVPFLSRAPPSVQG